MFIMLRSVCRINHAISTDGEFSVRLTITFSFTTSFVKTFVVQLRPSSPLIDSFSIIVSFTLAMILPSGMEPGDFMPSMFAHDVVVVVMVVVETVEVSSAVVGVVSSAVVVGALVVVVVGALVVVVVGALVVKAMVGQYPTIQS
jgi:hypothetical protein